jgi:tetrapyrrole methylase family protein/MazG family protein
MSSAGKKFEELMNIMAALRAPSGCPWDREQTHATLTPTFIEELYEFIDAVEENDSEMMKEELGDLCLHVAFQAQIAQENNEFTLSEALDGINQKLVRRHPHVFGEVKVENAGQVVENWEQIKKEEKGDTRTSALDGIPRHLPALSKAHKVQRKARKVGFDWDDIEDVLKKVDEEMGELREALRSEDQDAIEDEMGDVLFSVVNVSRFVDVEPEQALHRTVRKFTNRFRKIEERLKEKGISIEDASFEEMDALWDAVKKE